MTTSSFMGNGARAVRRSAKVREGPRGPIFSRAADTAGKRDVAVIGYKSPTLKCNVNCITPRELCSAEQRRSELGASTVGGVQRVLSCRAYAGRTHGRQRPAILRRLFQRARQRIDISRWDQDPRAAAADQVVGARIRVH